jgi:hypothetical protein
MPKSSSITYLLCIDLNWAVIKIIKGGCLWMLVLCLLRLQLVKILRSERGRGKMKNVIFALVIGISIVAIGISGAYAGNDGKNSRETWFQSKMYGGGSEYDPHKGECTIYSDATCKVDIKVTVGAEYCDVTVGGLQFPWDEFTAEDVPVIDGELKLTEETCNFEHIYDENPDRTGIALILPYCRVQCDDGKQYINAVLVVRDQQ